MRALGLVEEVLVVGDHVLGFGIDDDDALADHVKTVWRQVGGRFLNRWGMLGVSERAGGQLGTLMDGWWPCGMSGFGPCT